jgi:hypothetical protein
MPLRPRQHRAQEFDAAETLGKGVELRAVTDVAEKLFRISRRHAKHADRALGRYKQARHQVHQCRLAGAIRTDQAGDPRFNRQADTIDTEDFTVEFGNVLEENDAIVRKHQRTTSQARIFFHSMNSDTE